MDTFQPSATLGPRTCCGCCRRRAGAGCSQAQVSLPWTTYGLTFGLTFTVAPFSEAVSPPRPRPPPGPEEERGRALESVRLPARLPGPLPASDATPRQAGCPGLACAPSRSRTAAPPASSGLLPCAVSAGCAPHPREEPSTAAARRAPTSGRGAI